MHIEYTDVDVPDLHFSGDVMILTDEHEHDRCEAMRDLVYWVRARPAADIGYRRGHQIERV